jgi:hypothetical protein
MRRWLDAPVTTQPVRFAEAGPGQRTSVSGVIKVPA